MVRRSFLKESPCNKLSSSASTFLAIYYSEILWTVLQYDTASRRTCFDGGTTPVLAETVFRLTGQIVGSSFFIFFSRLQLGVSKTEMILVKPTFY